MTTRFRSKHRNKTTAGFSGIIAILILMFVTSCAPQGVTSASGAGLQTATTEEVSGTELVNITFEGGSGKAHVISPVEVTHEGGKSYARLVFSSTKYDYVIVGGVKYINETPGENSTFTVPVESFDVPLDFIGDTLAMSTPHEIKYRIIWNGKASDDNAGSDDFRPDEAASKAAFGIRPEDAERGAIAGILPGERLPLSYANGFDVTKYGDYSLISIYGVGDYLLVPEGKKAPDGLDEDITPLYAPLDKTYLVSTSAMDLVRQIGALDMIKLSPLQSSDWYIEEAKQLLDSGQMKYAGKYRAPDYELILSEGCSLAVENTMIYHDPEVKEKLEELGIPVIVETSSYENSPLGRLEWIKLYGVLFSKEKEAADYFEKEAATLKALRENKTASKSVAFFSVSENKTIVVRAPGDYITGMIEMAGGAYVPSDTGLSEEGMGTVNMQPEAFFASAKDADIIIYNSTIVGSITSVDDLIGKNPLFSEFRAVKEGNVYCLDPGFFQKTTEMPAFVVQLSGIIDGTGDGGNIFRKL